MRKFNCHKIKRKLCASALAASVLMVGVPAVALGASTASGPAMETGGQTAGNQETAGGGEQSVPQTQIQPAYNGDVNSLKAAAQTNQLIVVVGDPSDPAKSVLTYYEKDANGLLQTVFELPAVSGMNGISSDKVEGDKKTPQGVYSFTMAFGMKEDPGSILPYRKVVNGDHFVDDPDSSYYNRLVNEFQVTKDWKSSENLIRQAPHYNYALVLNYNDTYVPGKGSAIFLHCPKTSNNTGTSGCISIPEEQMKYLVTKADQNTKIIVVPEQSWLAFY